MAATSARARQSTATARPPCCRKERHQHLRRAPASQLCRLCAADLAREPTGQGEQTGDGGEYGREPGPPAAMAHVAAAITPCPHAVKRCTGAAGAGQEDHSRGEARQGRSPGSRPRRARFSRPIVGGGRAPNAIGHRPTTAPATPVSVLLDGTETASPEERWRVASSWITERPRLPRTGNGGTPSGLQARSSAPHPGSSAGGAGHSRVPPTLQGEEPVAGRVRAGVERPQQGTPGS